jgi:hypothetical protein
MTTDRRNFLRLAGAGVLMSAGLYSPQSEAGAAGSGVAAGRHDRCLARSGDSAITGSIDFPELRIGESWAYDERDGYNRMLKAHWIGEIVFVDDSGVEMRILNGQPGNARSNRYGRRWEMVSENLSDNRQLSFSPALVSLPFPLQPGKSWRQDVVATDSFSGKSSRWRLYGRVRGWEKVKVPAGEFDAIKIVRDLYLDDADWRRSQTRRTERDWYAPEVKWIVKQELSEEYLDQDGELGFRNGDRLLRELVSFTCAM